MKYFQDNYFTIQEEDEMKEIAKRSVKNKSSIVPQIIYSFKQYKWLYFLLIPGVVYFAVFRYAPMYGLIIAFKNYVPFLGINGSDWVGLQNFKEFISNPDFFRLFTNTLILSVLTIAFTFPVPIILALLLNELRLKFTKKMIQTAIYIPHFLSWTIIVSITFLLFSVENGIFTNLAQMITGNKIDFLTSPAWFRPLIVLQTIWKETGWNTIIYLAALSAVDQEQYEAAIIDGAGRFQRLIHVTLPAIKNTIILLLIMRVGSILNNGFDQIYLMMNSLNRSVADVFDTYVYVMGITQGAYSYSTAVGLFKSVISLILVLGANKIANYFEQDGLF